MRGPDGLSESWTLFVRFMKINTNFVDKLLHGSSKQQSAWLEGKNKIGQLPI